MSIVTQEEAQKKMDDFFIPKPRAKVLALLEKYYWKGYRYVVRDDEGDYLTLYSIKPKKYRDGEFWGYREADLSKGEALPAAVIRNDDMTEINWHNRSATLIAVVIGFAEEVE